MYDAGEGGGGVAGHGIIPLMPGFSGRHWGAFYNSTCRDHAKLACVHIAVTAMCPPYQTFAEAAVKSGFFSREQHCTFLQRIPNIQSRRVTFLLKQGISTIGFHLAPHWVHALDCINIHCIPNIIIESIPIIQIILLNLIMGRQFEVH